MRTAVFVSGRGSNLKAFLDENLYEDVFVFSNKKTEPMAFGWAKKRGVTTELVSLQNDKDWSDLADKLNSLKIRKIFLLGFMKIVPEIFLIKIKSECLNLHPSILPDFPGLNSIEKTFDEQKSMGCTVHKVSSVVDAGKVCLQKRISSPKSDFLKFEEQVHQAEQDSISKYCSLKSARAEAS